MFRNMVWLLDNKRYKFTGRSNAVYKITNLRINILKRLARAGWKFIYRYYLFFSTCARACIQLIQKLLGISLIYDLRNDKFSQTRCFFRN